MPDKDWLYGTGWEGAYPSQPLTIQNTVMPIYTDCNVNINHQISKTFSYNQNNNEWIESVLISVRKGNYDSHHISPEELAHIYSEYTKWQDIQEAAKNSETVNNLLNQLLIAYKLSGDQGDD